MGVKITSDKKCFDCGINHEIELPNNTTLEKFNEDVKLWKSGQYIQQVMPYLNDESREILISGMCDLSFKNIESEDDFNFEID